MFLESWITWLKVNITQFSWPALFQALNRSILDALLQEGEASSLPWIKRSREIYFEVRIEEPALFYQLQCTVNYERESLIYPECKMYGEGAFCEGNLLLRSSRLPEKANDLNTIQN